MEVEEYESICDQNEELGLNGIQTNNYQEEEGGVRPTEGEGGGKMRKRGEE